MSKRKCFFASALRLLTAAMFVVLFFLVPGKTDLQAETPGDFVFILNSRGEAVITDYKGTNRNIVVPSVTEDGHIVSSVGENAFAFKSTPVTVVLPSTITTVEDGAFSGCTYLTSINIPDGVTEIRNNTFNGCMNLKNCVIGKSVRSIGVQSFYMCSSLENIELPDTLMFIGESAFSGCISLKEINFPDSLQSIDNYAFCSCSSLKSIVIPNLVKNLGYAAFIRCTAVNDVVIYGNMPTISEFAFAYCSRLKRVVVASNTATIGAMAFGECSLLGEVTLPDSVINIAPNAFYKYNGITNLPASFLLRCSAKSRAMSYAIKFDIPYEVLPYSESNGLAEISDVLSSAWYFPAVRFCLQRSYFTGLTSEIFEPDMYMTRAMFVVVMGKMARIDITEYYNSNQNFYDVHSGKWYTPYINWACSTSLISGYGNGYAGVYDNITREQLALILYKYFGHSETLVEIGPYDYLSSYSDRLNVSSWSEQAIKYMIANGLMTGSDGFLRPHDYATRAEVAQMIFRYCTT